MRKVFVLLGLFLALNGLQISYATGYVPPEGFVPDKETAIAIAVAIWSPIYGKGVISKEKPYVARLEKGIWYVSSTFNTWWGLRAGFKGGSAEAEIDQKTGKILSVYRTK